jgi:hypothetical protein
MVAPSLDLTNTKCWPACFICAKFTSPPCQLDRSTPSTASVALTGAGAEAAGSGAGAAGALTGSAAGGVRGSQALMAASSKRVLSL